MLPNPIPAPILERRPPTPDEIKARRLAADQSPQKAAETIYVTDRAWRLWEQGKRQMPLGLYHLYCLLTIPYRDPYQH